MGLLLALVFGNEYLRNRYTRLRFNIAVYYFLLLTYCIISVPTFIFHSIGTGFFIASGLISLAIMAAYLALLYAAVLRKTPRGLFDATVIVTVIFCIFSGLYFLDIIPPVPLSLKNIGIYHSVLKQSEGGYYATYEPAQWYVFWRDTSGTYTINALGGDSTASCFSSVFAPTDLNTVIYHEWKELDPSTGQWQSVARISFPISGGRAGGYEGYTIKTVAPGQWRCDVESQSGALIGRVSFTVVAASSSPQLSQTTL